MNYRQHKRPFVSAMMVVLLSAGPCCLPVFAHSEQGYFSTPERVADQEYQEMFAQVAPNVYMAGQPTELALTRLSELGVTTVVNLRTQFEMDNRGVVPFDEAAALEELDLTYVHIPLGGPNTPYNPDAVSRLAEAIAAAEGNVLLHCTVAWRASHLWTAYLIRHQDVPVAQAIEIARQLNFGDIPLEGFLGQSLRIELQDGGEG